eukprot:TRINITY_DN3900_c0_g2_i1.p1 TRINITY_DN3900_c0_g2~~TRINITY_DN3900_c0_g2_i1.p1  ORF type:complete len:571 (+),score=184.07 TRINITY_DN3900_c0_g2_i1:79-1713(+)
MRALRAAAALLAAATHAAAHGPGDDRCGPSFQNAPVFHLMDQKGCAENDPNGPVFDPVHGVYHLFYQDHIATPTGRGPDYGHWVSRDFVHWAQLPVAIWNGLDVPSGRQTAYDSLAIYTGSATLVPGMAPDGKSPGVVQIYPGICDGKDKTQQPPCNTGTMLAVALPADYANDPLLTNWSKPTYNPIVADTQRDPSTMWKTPHGEWRLRTYDSMEYGSASDADVKAGKWYTIGKNPTFVTAECPSLYELPPAAPGFEAEYERSRAAGDLPSHVMKLSHGQDFVQLGDYAAGAPRQLGNFSAHPGWSAEYQQFMIDQGKLYASKDFLMPDGKRRINWGWARVPPASTQTLPREVTFNPVVRRLQWAPAKEVDQLRGSQAASLSGAALRGGQPLHIKLDSATGRQCEISVAFELPAAAARMGVTVMGSASDASQGTLFYVDWAPPSDPSAPFYEVTVGAGSGTKDTLRLIPGERELSLRLYVDWTFTEVYWQGGRVASTVVTPGTPDAAAWISSSADATVATAQVWQMQPVWTTAAEVLRTPRADR